MLIPVSVRPAPAPAPSPAPPPPPLPPPTHDSYIAHPYMSEPFASLHTPDHVDVDVDVDDKPPPLIIPTTIHSTTSSPSSEQQNAYSTTMTDIYPSVSSTLSPTSIPPDQRLTNQIAVSKQIAQKYANVSAIPFEDVQNVIDQLRDTHAQLTLVAIGQYSEERSNLIHHLDHLISRYTAKLPTTLPSTSPTSYGFSSSPTASPMSLTNGRQLSYNDESKHSSAPVYTSTFIPDPTLNPDWDSWSINRWGELVKRGADDKKQPKNEKMRKKMAAIEQAREFKWVKMTRNWDTYFTKKYEKLKRRVRKGIPDSLRAMVWPLITGSHQQRIQHPDLYAKLILQHSPHEEQIGRDINRTFPNHVFFKEDSVFGSMGRESLTNVLKAYAIYDSELGYCQGMGFLVGIFLMYLSEEESFWMLVTLLRGDRFFINGFYSSGFPLLHQYFYQLLQLMKRHLPKLHSHLKKHQIEPSLYATQWFITLFTYNLSFDTLMRVWDILFLEGPKILFRVALALLKMNEKRLLAADMENIFITFREIESHPGSNDPDVLIQAALKFAITRAEIEQYAKEYQVVKLKEDQAKRKREEDRKAAKANGTTNGKH